MDHLKNTDPQIFGAIVAEARRQAEGLELIASENFVSRAVLEAMGSVTTDKYAEGLPSKRYYGGCEYVDVAEARPAARISPHVRPAVRRGDPGSAPGAPPALSREGGLFRIDGAKFGD